MTPLVARDLIPVEVLTFGATMLVVIMLIHGYGLGWITEWHERGSGFLTRKQLHPAFAAMLFALTVLFMLWLHIIEAVFWGVSLYKVHLITSLRDSMYFSANTYTTIGYGLMILPLSWRELAPIMAISGLFAFAWTTGEMFNVIGLHRKTLSELRAFRRQRKEVARAARAR